MIRPVNKTDIPAICNIYNFYVKNTIITFEEEEVSAREIEKRIEEITKNFPWLVYVENGVVLGYAYASSWKSRSAYRFSAESTVYLSQESIGKGIGSKLYSDLIVEAKNKGIHSLIGGIAQPNDESVALHEKLGFQKCAHFKEIGFKFNKWIDVGYWEKRL